MKSAHIKIGLIILLVSHFSFYCKSPGDEFKEDVSKIVKQHLTIKLNDEDSTLVLDSMRIISIDTLSSKDILGYKVRHYIDSLEKETELFETMAQLALSKAKTYRLYKNLYDMDAGSYEVLNMRKQDAENYRDEYIQKSEQIKILSAELDSLTNLWQSDKIDSTDFLMHEVVFKGCYSNKAMEQDCRDSLVLMLTKDLRISRPF